MKSRFLLNFVLIAALACLVPGCGKESPAPVAPGTTSSPPTPAVSVTPDDEAAVAALSDAGFILTKNADGMVTECSKNTDEDISVTLAHLAGLHSVQSLRLSGPAMGDTGMEVLAEFAGLKRLDLSDSAITDETLQHVSGLQNLEVLGLRRTGVTDSGLAAISGLPKVRAIDLRNSNITDDGLTHFFRIVNAD